ncbi:MAG: aldolase [Pseudomonadota bacterium]
MKGLDVCVPLDVPESMHGTYQKNFTEATRGTGRLMLFAGDQKIEHLNDDFFGKGIAPEDSDPEHLFRIADRAKVGVFAAQAGLIARYGMDYRGINYLVKLNSKTPIVGTKQKDPVSRALLDMDQLMEFKETSGLNIVGVGYTIYIGSEYEAKMFTEASRIIHEAHRNGLLVVLWIYPRGKALGDEKDPHLIAGATGVAACLGADFVKVNYPVKLGVASAEAFKEAVKAAGRTHVICAGGSSTDVKKFLQDLHDQIFISGARGNATGRNIHQKPLDEAVRMCRAISAITLENRSVDEAMAVYQEK